MLPKNGNHNHSFQGRELTGLRLAFPDLEVIEIDAAMIKDFSYQIKDQIISSYQLVLDLPLENTPSMRSLTYPSGSLSQTLTDYLYCDHPSVRTIQVLVDGQLGPRFQVEWQLLPNPSLADCQCEPINGRSYSKQAHDHLIIGNRLNGETPYMAQKW